MFIYGRGNRNRTCDPLHPMQVLYQAELCPDMPNILNQHLPKHKYFFRYSYILLGYSDRCKICMSGQKVFTTNKRRNICVKWNMARVANANSAVVSPLVTITKKRIQTNPKNATNKKPPKRAVFFDKLSLTTNTNH